MSLFNKLKKNLKQAKNGETEPMLLDDSIFDWKSRKPWKWYNHVWWWIRYGIWNHISDLKWQIPNACGRMKRGWGHADTWGFDVYLAKVISEGLKHLKKHKHGYPVILPTIIEGKVDYSKVDEEANIKLWDEILDNMIYTFETALEISDHNTMYISSKDWSEELYQKNLKFAAEMNTKFPDLPHKVMSRKEVNRYESGWSLFSEYFFSLWD